MEDEQKDKTLGSDDSASGPAAVDQPAASAADIDIHAGKVEPPKQILPLCPLCGHDPLLPLARQINVPVMQGMPPGAFLVVYCKDCRGILNQTQVMFLGYPQQQEQPQILRPNGPMPRRPQ